MKLIRYLTNIKWWFLHRTFKRYNLIRIPSLEPGYHDKDRLMLYGMFDLLVEYVEQEVAWLEFILNKKYSIPWWKSTKRAFKGMDKEKLGLDYLNNVPECEEWERAGWERQKKVERKVVKLYMWWKHEYPKMRDAVWDYDFDSGSPDEYMSMEDNLIATENRMLKQLIDIRTSLWT